jgi:hypothetical protein
MLFQEVSKLAFGTSINRERSEVYFRIEFTRTGRTTRRSELHAAFSGLGFPLSNLANQAIVTDSVRQVDLDEQPVELVRDYDENFIVFLTGYRLHQDIAREDIISECKFVLQQHFVGSVPTTYFRGEPMPSLVRGLIRSGILTAEGMEHFAEELTHEEVSQRRVRHSCSARRRRR